MQQNNCQKLLTKPKYGGKIHGSHCDRYLQASRNTKPASGEVMMTQSNLASVENEKKKLS